MRKQGYALLDALAGCALMILVLLPLLAEFQSWLERRHAQLRRYSLHAEAVRLRASLSLQADVVGTPRATLWDGEVSVARGEEQIWKSPGAGRLSWRKGEELDWLILEVKDDGAFCRVSVPLPATP